MRAGTRDVSTPPDSVRFTLTVRNGVSAKLDQMLNETVLVIFIQGRTRSYPPRTPNLPELTHQQNTRETRMRLDRRARDVRRAPAADLTHAYSATTAQPLAGASARKSSKAGAIGQPSRAPSVIATQTSRRSPLHASRRFPGPSKETTPASSGSGTGL